MAYDLEDITKPAGASPGAGGGLHNEVILMLADDVETIPVRGEDLVTMTGNIVMKTGKYMHSIYSTPKTLEITHKKIKGDNADIVGYEVGLKFFHPDLKAAILSFKAKHSASKFYALIRNCAANMVYFMGEPCNELLMDEAESVWGKNITDGKGTNFTFLTQQKNTAAVYTGTFTLPDDSGSGSGA